MSQGLTLEYISLAVVSISVFFSSYNLGAENARSTTASTRARHYTQSSAHLGGAQRHVCRVAAGGRQLPAERTLVGRAQDADAGAQLAHHEKHKSRLHIKLRISHSTLHARLHDCPKAFGSSEQ